MWLETGTRLLSPSLTLNTFIHVATTEHAYFFFHTHSTPQATVRNAAQLVRPDEFKYSSVASANYKRCRQKKIWQCDDSTSKISHISTGVFLPFCNRIQNTTLQ